MTSPLQMFPPLEAATEAALRASIQRFGVIVPVVRNQHGQIIDGHNRARIAKELGVKFPVDVREIETDEDARELAETLNTDRRHLSVEQRREVVVALREDGHSQRAIAGALGVAQSTVHADLGQLIDIDQLPARVTGLDGRSRPATKPPEEPIERKGRQGVRDRTKPFTVKNQRGRMDAEAQKRRLIEGVSTISGLCKGLDGVDLLMAAAVLSTDEIAEFSEIAGRLSRALRKLQKDLAEVRLHAREAQQDRVD